ncbi:MAG TPA: tetratricopeptide repeat protein, partial [Burkholderiales bacterium]|nr:tetratricopeptide repeat protein [Burkholderiales bacterium]
LKKAERAKEEAQRRSQGERPEATLGAPPPRQPEPPLQPEAGAEPVRTREQLPDIRQPLEFLGDEPQPRRAEPTLVLEPEKARPEPATAPRPQPKAEVQAQAQASERATARKVFEAKFREPNPRLPFFITLGALGVFTLGTVVYFWMQLRPPAPLVNTNPQRPSGEQQLAVAAEPRPAAPAAPAGAIPGLPGAAPAAPAPAVPVIPAKPTPQVAETPLLKPPLRTVAPAPRAPAASEISATRTAPQVHPRVGSAYAAYVGGDLATARSDYQQALHEEPANRDALLGLAALDVRGGRLELAEAAYLRLLQADPRDAHAQAALIALRAGRVDPVAAESRVKSMLAEHPAAHVLNFTLGNQFAQQGRWAEAQQEYFKAFAAEPDNADFAYNLAVSLDHLRQPRLALEYYRRALSLAKARSASFDVMAAEARAAQLGR